MKQLSLLPDLVPEKSKLSRQDSVAKIIEEIRNNPLPKHPIVVSFGGGVNSTAMLIAARLKRIKIDHIVFSDTGNENPETYEFIEFFDHWLQSPWYDYPIMPGIEILRYEPKRIGEREKIKRSPEFLGKLTPIYLFGWAIEYLIKQFTSYTTLGEQCLLLETIPSKAFGNGSCSAKWKIDPSKKYWESLGGTVISWVGIHAGEVNRLINKSGDIRPLEIGNSITDYPLIRWGLDQSDCVRLCQVALGFVPRKSACWFCPNAKPSEVLALKQDHPDIYEIACFMEEQAMRHITSIKGLGRNFSWREIDKINKPTILQLEMMASTKRCHCTDV